MVSHGQLYLWSLLLLVCYCPLSSCSDVLWHIVVHCKHASALLTGNALHMYHLIKNAQSYQHLAANMHESTIKVEMHNSILLCQ